MAFLKLATLLTLSLFQLQAFAQTTTVPTESLKILGEGISNSSREQSVVLACVNANDDCKYARFLYFTSPNQAQWVGPTFKLPYSSDPELLRKAIKLLVEEYFATHESPKLSDESLNKRRNLMIYGGIGISIAAGATGVLPILIAIPALAVLAGDHSVIQNMIDLETISVPFSQNEGWNWSQHAHQVSDKKFNRFMVEIKNAVDGGDHSNMTTERMWKNRDRMERKKDRLKLKGVTF